MAQEAAAGVALLLERLDDPSSTYVFVAAHRGGRERDWQNRAPENSLANIEKAVRMGFDVYETDIRQSADGELMIMHDVTVDRTTDGSGGVRDLPLARLKELKLKYSNGRPSQEPVPTFEEFLVHGRGRILFKADYHADLAALPRAVDLLEKHGMLGHVLFRLNWSDETARALEELIEAGMPYHRHLILFRTRSPEEARAALSRFDLGTLDVDGHVGILGFARRVADRLGLERIEAWLDALPLPPQTAETIRIARQAGVLVVTRSSGGPSEWRRLIDRGVRMIHTEQPELLTAWLRQRGLHP